MPLLFFVIPCMTLERRFPASDWRHTPILVAIYKVVSHLDHHTGQIVLLTKQMAGTDLDLSIPRKR